MHICIPDTVEVRPPTGGGAYLLYNVHIDGLYHCSSRFKQLLHLHQALTKKFSGPYHHQLPPFPPKKLLPLSVAQLEERRVQLEKYLQNISQDKAISNSSIFNLFLLEAQRESTRIRESQVHLDVELVNGQKIRLHIVTHDSADTVLTAVCRALGLNDRYHAYFCLCLCGYDVVRDKLIIKRRLSFFESPFITLQMAIQQQEQLQNVLSSPMVTNCYNNNNYSSINENDCKCLSCSTQQDQRQSQSGAAIAPLVGSSSGTFVGDGQLSHYNQQTNHHYQHSCRNGSNGNYSLNSFSSLSSSSSSSRPFVTHRILLRKSYWDPIYDTYLLNDSQALNLLFIQTVYDIKHSLMFVSRETYYQLESLLASDSKLEYILLARNLKYYNYVHFEPCYSDYPRPRTKVMISIGSKELSMRVLKTLAGTNTESGDNMAVKDSLQQSSSTSSTNNSNNNPDEPTLYCTSSLVPGGYSITKDDIVEEEYKFKVPLIRCWRLTSLEALNYHDNNNNNNRQRRPSISATTTLAGGKRKSLSLFNSVVGISTNGNNINNSSNDSNQPYQHSNDNIEHPFAGSVPVGSNNSIISGTDGASLLNALSGSTSFFWCQQQQQQQTNNLTNHHNNQAHVSSGNNTNSSMNHQYCQHENQRFEPALQQQPTQFSQYELSFEYLVSKDTLKWITISSDQAIFISISLQGVVDELVSKRDGNNSLFNGPSNFHAQTVQPLTIGPRNDMNNNSNQINQNQLRSTPDRFTYLYRNGAQKQLTDKFGTTLGYSPMSPYSLALWRHRQQERSPYPSFSLASVSSSTSNLMPAFFWSPSELLSTGNGSSNGGAIGGRSTRQSASFEIKSLKKAPSPIINDAFEGTTTNDDDL